MKKYRLLVILFVLVLVLVFVVWDAFFSETKTDKNINESERVVSQKIEQSKPSLDETHYQGIAQSKIESADSIVSTNTIVNSENWLSPPISNVSNQLMELIEREDIGYVDIGNYPFSETQQLGIRSFSSKGKIILFENTSPEYLDSYNTNFSDIVSEYFGAAAEGDIIMAISTKNSAGGVNYLVLPVQFDQINNLTNDVEFIIKQLRSEANNILTGTNLDAEEK